MYSTKPYCPCQEEISFFVKIFLLLGSLGSKSLQALAREQVLAIQEATDPCDRRKKDTTAGAGPPATASVEPIPRLLRRQGSRPPRDPPGRSPPPCSLR